MEVNEDDESVSLLGSDVESVADGSMDDGPLDIPVQGVSIPLSPPPQTNSGVVQTIQIHCSKLEPFSAIDFKGFCFL